MVSRNNMRFVVLFSFIFLATKSVLGASPLDRAWNEYLAEVNRNATHGLQSACVPRRFRAVGTKRGTAVLFHGYSACPQQFDDFGPLLAARGFDVIVPLIPGMGNNFNDSATPPSRFKCPFGCDDQPVDDVSGMPTSPQGYVDFVSRINRIAQHAPGVRVVAGLSVGGSIAAFAGQATDATGSSLYQRQLIMNPMIKAAVFVEELVLELLDLSPLTRELWLGWGPGCRTERAGGRGGICTFTVENSIAASDFGRRGFEDLQPPNASVALVYDQGDPVVSTAAIRDLADKYSQHGTDTLSCVLNFTLHSMLSKWDNVGENRWWTNELYCDMVAYLADAIPFPKSNAQNPNEGGEHYCHLGCTSTTCKYNISAPLSCPFSPPKVQRPHATEIFTFATAA